MKKQIKTETKTQKPHATGKLDFKKMVKGILFHGPPRTGKTHVSKILIEELKL